MKVLQLIKTPVGATWAVDQIRGLREVGIDVHAAIPNGPRAEDLANLGVETHDIQTDTSANPGVMWNRVRALQDLVGRLRPDIVHSHFVGTTITMRLALRHNRDLPRIFQVPGPLHLENPITRRVELNTAQAADTWIATSEWTRNAYVDAGINPSRVALSYYGRDVDQFAVTRPGKLRKELEIGDSTSIVGMVAYMYPPKRWLGQKTGLKGHEDLIEATSRLVANGHDIEVVFVGGAWNEATWYEDQVQQVGEQLLGNRARFLGTRDDVTELYADIDIAVHPSHSENVGGAVESLLAGVPTVSTDVGGFPDIVHHRETGLLVPPHRPDLLASAIAEILGDIPAARRTALAGRALVRELFDINRTTLEVAEVYRARLCT